jgi:hypothetical protein
MLEFGKEYFSNEHYFYLKDMGDKFSVYYSVGKKIKESKDQDSEIVFLKEAPTLTLLILMFQNLINF